MKLPPTHDTIRRADYPQLDAIAWFLGGASTLAREQALVLYERNWRYVEVRDLTPKEVALITDLAQHEGHGVFAPDGGQPIALRGVHVA